MTNPINFSSYFDHTNLKQDATEKDIAILCQEAIDYKFFSVCVNPCYVSLAKNCLVGRDVKVTTVIGFPLGANETATKINEALLAVKNGADELDMVANIGFIKERRFSFTENEITEIRKNIGKNITLKVIVESSILTGNEIIDTTKLIKSSGADFIKTSTGIFGGASIEAVKLMRIHADWAIGIKAAGGIKTLTVCHNMISAGATRLGCSASVQIMQELLDKN